MNPNCPICRGIGWVCENHPEKPWDLELGCVCGAGAPCKCNETDGVHEPDVSQVIGEEAEAPLSVFENHERKLDA